MKKISLFIVLALLGMTGLSYGQVGIGNPNPDSTSVLDLTNPNNRGLVLPGAASTAGFSNTSTLGMTYFFNDQIFYKRSDGYNALSPWRYKFNGNLTDDVYYNLGGNIGIGSTNLSTSPEAPLHIETDNTVDLVGNGSLLIGRSAGTNLILNSTEIQSRNAASGSTLKINEDGGDVEFGSAVSPVDVGAAGKMQELHQPTSSYNDLLPLGSIIMWYGDTSDVPAGWAVCDGGTYGRSDNIGTVTTPDLRGRFVVGAGNNGTSDYAAHAVGGQDSVALTVNELASHNHNVRDLGHRHSYFWEEWHRSGEGDNASDNNFPETWTNRTDQTGYATANIAQDNRGGNAPHENRPTFHALVYIMKL